MAQAGRSEGKGAPISVARARRDGVRRASVQHTDTPGVKEAGAAGWVPIATEGGCLLSAMHHPCIDEWQDDVWRGATCTEGDETSRAMVPAPARCVVTCSINEIARRALAGEGDQRCGRPLLIVLGQALNTVDCFLEPSDHVCSAYSMAALEQHHDLQSWRRRTPPCARVMRWSGPPVRTPRP